MVKEWLIKVVITFEGQFEPYGLIFVIIFLMEASIFFIVISKRTIKY